MTPAALTPGALDEIEARLAATREPQRAGESLLIAIDRRAAAGGELMRMALDALPALIASAREAADLRERIAAVIVEREEALAGEVEACADRDALAAKLGEVTYERDSLKRNLSNCVEKAHGFMADLAKAREELMTAKEDDAELQADYERRSALIEQQAAAITSLTAERDEAWRGHERLSLLIADRTAERDEANAALEYQRDAIQSAVDGENEARAQLAALEVRAADARMVCEWLTGDTDDKEPREAAFAAARRYLASAPAAPAKAEETLQDVFRRKLRGPVEPAPSPLAAQLAEAFDRGRTAGRLDVGKYSSAIESIEVALGHEGARPLRDTIAAVKELRRSRDEAVRLMRAAPTKRDDVDDWAQWDVALSGFLSAIDAGRARAKETK